MRMPDIVNFRTLTLQGDTKLEHRETITFGLLENGLDFVKSAVNYLVGYREKSDLKYGILHLSAGIELILKYRLSKEHWSLVFQNFDKVSKPKLMKRVLILLIISVLLVGGCLSKPASINFTDLYLVNTSAITKLYMLNGKNGENRTTSDVAKISEFVTLLNSLKYAKEGNQNPRSGYLYYVDLYEGGQKMHRITFAGDAEFDTTYYSLSRNIDADLNDFFQSLK